MNVNDEIDDAMQPGGEFEQIMSAKKADLTTVNKMINAKWHPVYKFNSLVALISTFEGTISLFVLSKKLGDTMKIYVPYTHKNSNKEGMGPIYTVIRGAGKGNKDALIFRIGSMDPAGPFLAAKIRSMSKKESLYSPLTGWQAEIMGDPESSSSGVEVVKPKYYKIKAEDIDVLATLANTPIDIKVNSALFPSTHLFITENMELIEKSSTLVNAIEASKKSKTRSDDRAIGWSHFNTGTLLFSFRKKSYTIAC